MKRIFSIVMFLSVLSSLAGSAFAGEIMDCFAGRSEVEIYNSKGKLTLSYSLPGARQDDWTGPIPGSLISVTEDLKTYTFGSIVVTLSNPHEEDSHTIFQGRIKGIEGKNQKIECHQWRKTP